MKSRRLVWIITVPVLFVGAMVILRLRSQTVISENTATSDAISVTVAKVERGSIANRINVTGNLEGIHEAEIVSETSGKITKIDAEVEDYIPVNSSIAVVENDLQEIAVESARANSEKADADLKRVKELFSQNAVSETQLENTGVAAKAALAQLKLAQKNYDNTFLKTPIAGRLAQKFVTMGQMITPGTKIGTVVDDSWMKLKVGIPEDYVSSVRKGNEVKVTSDAVQDKIFSGKIKTIALKADQQTRTFQAEIDLPNDHDRSLKSGMFAKAEITAASDKDMLVIPVTALIEVSGSTPSVFVAKDSVVSLRHVTTGRRDDSLVEITSGLAPGDLVVNFGQQNLKDGTRVRYTVGN